MMRNEAKYPDMIIPNSPNNIGFLAGDYEKVEVPKLTMDKDIVIVYFRGYYFTDMKLGGSNEGLVSHTQNNDLFDNPVAIVNSVLKGLGEAEREFNDAERKLIEIWYKDSLEFFYEI